MFWLFSSPSSSSSSSSSSYPSYGIYLVATLISVVLAQVNTIVQQRDEYCAQGNLCLTSFNWCLSGKVGSVNGTIGAGYCDGRPIADDDRFLFSRSTGVFNGVTILYAGVYNLTWINADPDYPVRVDWYIGPSAGVVNSTVPSWSQNVTDATYLQFRPLDIFSDLRRDSNTSYVGYAIGWVSRFTISQPERPAPAGIITTDESNIFRMTDLTLEYAIRDIRRANQQILESRTHRWRLGVGLGVGLGVPLLLLVAFITGRVIGKKAGTRVAATGTQATSGKENHDLSDGDRSVVAS